MKKNLLSRCIIGVSNLVLLIAATSISQCSFANMYQPMVDANLKRKILQVQKK